MDDVLNYNMKTSAVIKIISNEVKLFSFFFLIRETLLNDNNSLIKTESKHDATSKPESLTAIH